MRDIRKLLFITGVATVTPVIIQARDKLPNIVIFFMDDMGYGDLTITGASGYNTPTIDRLASEGMFFTHFYAAQPISSASRAGLITGCYPNRVGISEALMPQGRIGVAPNEYLGLPYSNDMWPVDYDGNRVTPASNLPNKLRHPTLPLIDGNEKIRELWTLDDQAELTTLYTERAIQFIKKNREQPFFLYFAHSMPHVPLAVSNKFRGKSKQGLYGDVMLEVDWSVQQVLETIEELNLDENTLIIFTSDNGPWFSFGNHAGSTGGLREAKATTFEGGQRVPCIMCWKGVIPRGTVYNQLASTII